MSDTVLASEHPLARLSAPSLLIQNILNPGGATAVLGSVFLRLHLPNSVSITTVTYGQPRVGNENFANYGGSL